VLTPLDIERDFGLSEGNIFQGELTLEQLFFLRPAPGWAQYKTPMQGLYMCGSATHPGGGIMARPGGMRPCASSKRRQEVAHGRHDSSSVPATTRSSRRSISQRPDVSRSSRAPRRRRWLCYERGVCAGYRCATLAHTLGRCAQSIVRDMQLERRGVKFVHPTPRAVSVGLDGRALVFSTDPGRTARRDPAVFPRKTRRATPGVSAPRSPASARSFGPARDDAAVDRRAVHE
jgi:phytoene dehydrogenase-like protein